MAVDLADYVPALRREIQPPGSTLFDDVDDDTLEGYLSDAFWEARLDGFVTDYTESGGIVTPLTTAVDFPREQTALVVLYAGLKILRNRLLQTNTKFAAKAGPVEFATENSANLLTEMARQLGAVKDRLIAMNLGATNVALVDAFSNRNVSPESYSGYLEEWYLSSFGGN